MCGSFLFRVNVTPPLPYVTSRKRPRTGHKLDIEQRASVTHYHYLGRRATCLINVKQRRAVAVNLPLFMSFRLSNYFHKSIRWGKNIWASSYLIRVAAGERAGPIVLTNKLRVPGILTGYEIVISLGYLLAIESLSDKRSHRRAKGNRRSSTKTTNFRAKCKHSYILDHI